jgi:hypothetical protein
MAALGETEAPSVGVPDSDLIRIRGWFAGQFGARS